ncbi:MAG: hypothetical protein KF690_02545 [Bacteroidetes bacterium]|nr:hypothetical protein [Bacteroidota bacterium]
MRRCWGGWWFVWGLLWMASCTPEPVVRVYCDEYSRQAAGSYLAQLRRSAAPARVEVTYAPGHFILQKLRYGARADVVIYPYSPLAGEPNLGVLLTQDGYRDLPDTLVWAQAVCRYPAGRPGDTLVIGMAQQRHPMRYWQDRLQARTRWGSPVVTTYEIVPALLPGYLQEGLVDVAPVPRSLWPRPLAVLPGGLPFVHRVWQSPQVQALVLH